jgi:hypothetical protein
MIDNEEKKRAAMTTTRWKRSRVVMANPTAALDALRVAASKKEHGITTDDVVTLTVQRIRTYFGNERAKRKRQDAGKSSEIPPSVKRRRTRPPSATTPQLSSGFKTKARGKRRKLTKE